MLENMKNRRTIRKYTTQDIPDALLNELLEVAARASNTGNMQLYSVVITRDKANKEKLAPAHFNQPMITAAPVVLTFCADANRFVKWAELRARSWDISRNWTRLWHDSLFLILDQQSFCTAAEEKGLGICYLGTTAYNADKIIDALSLPHLVVPIVTVTVGYPDGMPEQVERLPLGAVVHQEVYTDYTPASIDALYHDKEELEVNKQFVRENDKETLAQVFTDVRYTKANNEYFSDVLLKVLKGQGFL